MLEKLKLEPGKRVIVVRHGQPDWNLKLGYGQGDPFLKTGRQDNLQRTIDALPYFDDGVAVFASPAAWAMECLATYVAAYVTDKTLDYDYPAGTVDPRLDQRSFGALSQPGGNAQAIKAYRERKMPDNERPEGTSPDYEEKGTVLQGRPGESFKDVAARVEDFCKERVLPQFEDRSHRRKHTVILFTHLGIAEAIAEAFGGEINSKFLEEGAACILETKERGGLEITYPNAKWREAVSAGGLERQK